MSRVMSRKTGLVAIAAFCGCALVTGVALTAARPEARQPELAPDHPLAAQFQFDEAAMMEAMMESGATGPAHEWLGQFIGEWKSTITIHMGDAPMVSQGTTTWEWLIPGRFIIDRMESEMMGMPMTGVGITGFDNLKRQYTGVWMDSMSTGIMPLQGSLDPTGKVLTMVGDMDEPTTGEMGKPVLFVTTIVDENHIRFDAREIIYGEAFTVFSIEYERAE
jgi:hypothetical protein